MTGACSVGNNGEIGGQQLVTGACSVGNNGEIGGQQLL